MCIAANCAALRATPTAAIKTKTKWRTGALACPALPLDSAPSEVQTSNAGAGNNNTASNNPATTAPTTVATSAVARRGSLDSLRSLGMTQNTNANANKTAAHNPRSATNAVQSLLGHGLNVIPASDGFRDRSSAGACRGNST